MKQSESGFLRTVVVNLWGGSALHSLHWCAHHPNWYGSSSQMLMGRLLTPFYKVVKNKGGIIWNHPGKESKYLFGLLVGLFQGVWFSLSCSEDRTWRPWDWITLFSMMDVFDSKECWEKNVDRQILNMVIWRCSLGSLYLSEPQLSLGICHCSCGAQFIWIQEKNQGCSFL